MKGRWIATITSLAAASMAFGAVALAQTPSPTATGTPTATATAESTTTPAITATATATTATSGTTNTPAPTSAVTGTSSTATTVSTVVATGTAVAAGTPFPTIPVPANIYAPGGQGLFPFAHSAMQQQWNRTDSLVIQRKVSRTWFWGPDPNTPGLLEPYAEAPTQARGQRLVQYFDKSRMEINNPLANASQQFFVTNGLLSVELISGFVQVGDKDFSKFRPACIPMSGDFGDNLAPTYFAFQGVSNTQAGDHNAEDRTGQNAIETIDRDGKLGSDPAKASVAGVKLMHYENHHNVPAAFWNFLNSTGPVYNANGQVVNEQLIVPWFYASGLPISEPYWAKAKIRGTITDVMIQAFERRVLTYVPTNPKGFQVEMGNIGQHYFDWRYRNFGVCPGTVVGTPTAPVPAPTGTAIPATGTPQATGTARVTTTVSPQPQATTTSVSTPQASSTVAASRTATATMTPIPATPVGTRVP